MANQEVANKNASGPSTLDRVRDYLRDTLAELKKVHWPTREETRNLTIIVFAVTFAMAAILGLFDYLFERMFFGLLKSPPEPVAVAIALVIVIAVIILVIFAGRERR